MTVTRDPAGFRLRGLNMTRIETFTDAAFAFALTLLVISMDPPATMSSLDAALRQIPSFLLSATLLMTFWAGHHNWSRRFGLDDRTTIVLSCLLVFTMLVYVYPLRFMFSAMMSWLGAILELPLGPDHTTLGIESIRDVNRMFVVYGLGFIAMSAAVALLNVHAWRRRDMLELDDAERAATRSEIGAWLILVSAGVLSTFIALLFPDSPPLAGWAYALLGITMPLYARRSRAHASARRMAPAVVVLLLSACSAEEPGADTRADTSGGQDGAVVERTAVEGALDAAIARLAARTDSIDDILQPVPLLTPAQEAALRRFNNAAQLARARSLGVRPAGAAGIEALVAEGRLVELEDSTPLWTVRELDHSLAFVTPDARALLARIAERFQDRLRDIGLPPYRVEVTSVLRTPETQADLRTTNPNAAAGVSTHEFGTTLDIAYSSFAAPADLEHHNDAGAAQWLAPRLGWFAARSLEAAAARKSRELQAILGEVLLQLQQAGDVMVTLERQQPVFHVTVARRIAD